MKKTMILVIALASITATAAPTKKKAISKNKKAAVVQVAAASTAQAAQAPAAAPAIEERQVASADVQVSPASGASSVDAAAQAAPAKKWSGKAQVYSNTDFTNTQNVQTLTTFSGSYKVLPKLGLKAGQTFETLTNGRDTSDATRELTKQNNFRTAYSEFGVSTTLPGFAGSDELPLSVNMKIMGGDSEYTTTGGYGSAYNFVETNLSVPFTLSPKWSVSIDSQWRAVDNKNDDVTKNANRLLVIPGITYTINDYVSVYQSAGWIGSFKDAENFRRNFERIYAETGVVVTPIKSLSITLMVDQDKAVYASPSSGMTVTDYSFYKPTEPETTIDGVAYEAVIAYTF